MRRNKTNGRSWNAFLMKIKSFGPPEREKSSPQKALLPWLAHLAHGSGHASKRGMQEIVFKTWYAPGFTAIMENLCHTCMSCQKHNAGKPARQAPGSHLPPWRPCVHKQMAFVQMPLHCRSLHFGNSWYVHQMDWSISVPVMWCHHGSKTIVERIYM